MEGLIRPTVARIDLDALRHNFSVIRREVGEDVRVLAPVKGTAYGHGAIPCALALQDVGCDAFGVALVEEGVALRQAGVEAEIICLGGVGSRGPEEAVAWDLTPMVYDLDTARALSKVAMAEGKVVPIHLKIDTGMGRLGVLPHDWEAFLQSLLDLEGLRVEGIATHFCDADLAEDGFTEEQGNRFRAALDEASGQGVEARWIHASNSAAALRYQNYRYSMVRVGLALYGVSPGPHREMGLKPVMSVTTEVLHVKTVPQGWGVSYGRTWTARKEARLATLPVGYADGYPRALSNVGEVLIHGRRCAVRGAVCMDLCLVDVTHLEETVKPGDEVVLLGEESGEELGAWELAERADTIAYDILCSFSERVPRRFKGA